MLFHSIHSYKHTHSLFQFLNFAPDKIMDEIIRVGNHSDKFQYFVSVCYEIVVSLCVVDSFIFMTDTIYFDDDLVLETDEITDVVSQCLLSTEIVVRSLQNDPHSDFREIHGLLIVCGVVSHLSTSFECNGFHEGKCREFSKKITSNTSPPCPLKNLMNF